MSEKLVINDAEGGAEAMPTYEEVRSKELEGYRERAGELGREYCNIEKDFREKYPEAQTKYPDDRAKQKFYNQYFIEKYESRIAENRREANACTKPLGMDGYELAELEKIDITVSHLEETVEVKSSLMYPERYSALNKKLVEEGAPEEKALLDNTWSLVVGYAEYKYADMTGYDVSGFRMHDTMRTEAHNKVIDQLNAMNDLARKYGEKPFTCRNFVTSRNYSEEKDKKVGKAYGDRASSDRKIVDYYFHSAFHDAMTRIEHKAN